MSEERRVFYIDIGDMSAEKAKAFIAIVTEEIRNRRPNDTGPVKGFKNK